MTAHDDQPTPAIEALNAMPNDELQPQPSKRPAAPSAPPNTPPPAVLPATQPLDVRATFDSLQLVNSIRESVVRDIVDKDSARLADALSSRLAPQVRDHVKAGVSAEFADRARVFGAIAGVGGIVLGFVGYQSLAQNLEVSAKQAAQEAAVVAAESQVRRHSDGFVAEMRSMRDGLMEQVRRDRERIEGAVDKAQSIAVDQMLRVSSHASASLREFEQEIQERTKQLVEDVSGTAVQEVQRVTSELRAEYERSRADFDRLVAVKSAEIRSAGDAVKSELSSLRGPRAGAGLDGALVSGSSPGPDDTLRLDRVERALQLDAERRFDLRSILDVAARFERAADSLGYRTAFDPIYNFPSAYAAAERQQVATLLTADWIPPQERRSSAIELMIAAMRSQDSEMFRIAERAYDSNLYTVSQAADPFVTLIKESFNERDSVRARTQFASVDIKSLTLRGRLNLAYIGKVIGEANGVEAALRGVLDELFESKSEHAAYLDRYTDYSSAAHVLDVLLHEPVVEKERVSDAARRIKRILFRSDSDPDPFGLRRRIDEFLGE